MHDPQSHAVDAHLRIDVAERLDGALDAGAAPSHFDATDPVGALVSLAAEVGVALHRPSLSPVERARIHAHAIDICEAHSHGGLRRAWPQLGPLRVHPAVVGGAAAAVLAVAGLVALHERRGHSGSVLHAA
jgi:hypothetical protein